MPTRPIPAADMQALVDAIHEALRKGYLPPIRHGGPPGNKSCGAIRAAAEALHLNRKTADNRVELLERRPEIYAGLGIDWSQWQRPKPPQRDDIPEVKAEIKPNERQRFEDEIARLNLELRDARREINEMEDLRSTLFGLTERPLEPVEFKPRRGALKREAETAILFTSDFQWGEVIKEEETDGLNRYDSEIAGRRYGRLIERSLDILLNHTVSPSYDRLLYLRGGDTISGEILEELVRTNDQAAIPAMRDVAAHEARGIGLLADALECPIEVISVPGNHGRLTRKPQSKSYVEHNFDDHIAWFLEAHFQAKDDDRITFRAPRSGDAYFSVYGHRFLLTHGDRIGSRGGQGFIGPAATIARGMKKLVDQYATVGKLIDVTLVGHFHVSLKLEHGYSNGSLTGYSEFARDLRARPAPPTQWLFKLHPNRGMTSQWEVHAGGPGEGSLCETAKGMQ